MTEVDHDTPTNTEHRTGFVAGLASEPAELAIVGLTAGLIVFTYPQASNLGWTPPIALTLAGLPVGMVALVVLACTRRPAALLAASLAAWCVITSLLSDAPLNSMFGAVSRWHSGLVYVGGLGAWALTTRLSPRGRSLLAWAVVAGTSISGLIGVMQMILKPTSGFLAFIGSRPGGLAANPVYLAAHAVACVAFFSYRLARAEWRWGNLVGLGAFVMLTSLTGSRVALLAAFPLAVIIPFLARTRQSLLAVPTFFVSVALAGVIHDATGSSASAGQRADLSGFNDRIEIWRFGLRAWLERPVTGWGLGRYKAASQRFYSDEWILYTGGDESAFAFHDSHNLVVQTLVTLGVVGLALVVAFVVAASRRASGPGIWMAAAIATTWMLQPPVAHTWVVALALLGASAPALARRDRPSATSRLAFPGAACVGLLLGSWLIVSDLRLEGAPDGLPMVLPVDVAMFRWDPVVASSMSDAGFDPSSRDPGPKEYVLFWSERAAELEPDHPLWWAKLALRRLRYDDLEGAQEAAQRGVAVQPTHLPSWQVLRAVAIETDDEALLAEANALLCRFDLGSCAGRADDSSG